MVRLEGLSASLGTVIAPAYFYEKKTRTLISSYTIEELAVEHEWQRFTDALEASRVELELLHKDSSDEQKEILAAHVMMLKDPEFISQVKDSLKSQLKNIESVLELKVAEATQMLRAASDTYLAERAIDIEDAFGRVMGHLAHQKTGVRSTSPTSLFVPPGVILVAKNLMPSEALSLKDSGIVGIILEEGGATSHVAILARSWQIPAVMGVLDVMDQLVDGEEIILDAGEGLVIAQPTKPVLTQYQEKTGLQKKKEDAWLEQKGQLLSLPTETSDGVKICLRANGASVGDAKQALEVGAEGIGLFRSEFLFVGVEKLPNEDEQYKTYSTIVHTMKGKPVILRTLDAGADKMITEQLSLNEKNPLLGWRAVRFCLDRKDIFKTQLRAMLRSSAHGDVRIMFPMISNVEELDACLDVLDEAKRSLAKESIAFNPELKVGIMIEVPSAAICADLLAQKVDFLSIGTNDLIQYTMAVDRENSKVAHLFDYCNPSVLRLIKMTLDAGNLSKIEVSMCGEMAGDPLAIPLLLGLGLKTFSMSNSLLLHTKALIRKLNLKEAQDLAASAMQLSAAREVRKLVEEKLKTYE